MLNIKRIIRINEKKKYRDGVSMLLMASKRRADHKKNVNKIISRATSVAFIHKIYLNCLLFLPAQDLLRFCRDFSLKFHLFFCKFRWNWSNIFELKPFVTLFKMFIVGVLARLLSKLHVYWVCIHLSIAFISFIAIICCVFVFFLL